MKSILETLKEHAQDEGAQSAIDLAQKWQIVLEDLCEAGSSRERMMAGSLLHRVNEALIEII